MKTIFKSMVVASFFLFFSTTTKAVSMGQILGRVTIKVTNEPLPYAEVVFENSMDKITVNANKAGYYYTGHMPTGRYQMRVTYNNRVFVMNKVRVYDNYDTEVNFTVSRDTSLPLIVLLETPDPVINSTTPTDIRMAGNTFNQPTTTLSDALSMQPGVNVFNGKVYIKGSSEVRWFIDGEPVMGPAMITRNW